MDEQLVGQPVFSEDGSKLGTVKEVQGAYVKVDAPLQRDYWLRSDALRAEPDGWFVARAGAEHYSTPEEAVTDTRLPTRGDQTTARAATHPQAGTTGVPETPPATPAGEHTLQLREERLRVTTAPEQTGAARLTRRIVEYTETVDVPLREERVTIERLAAGGAVIVDGRALVEGEQLEVVVRRERVRIEKEVVELERLAVRTEAVEHTERVQETVRKEELVVDKEGDVNVAADARRTGEQEREPRRG